jgi:pimeloyl-ACP methyl ester carboxylesterase
VSIHYSVAGEGDPALVFVHCWTCRRRFWDAQVPAFGPRHRVVTLDLAGHGESGSRRRDWTMAAFGEDVRAVAAHLDLRRAILIGHSMGGDVVLEAARLMPDRVVGVIPVDTLLNVEQRMSSAEIETTVKSLRTDFPAAISAFMRQRLFAPSTDPALVDRIVAGATAFTPEVAVAALANAWAYDAAAAFRDLRVPIVAVNADLYPTDVAANRRPARHFDALILPGVGHYPMLEAPERFNALLAEAIRRVLPAARPA